MFKLGWYYAIVYLSMESISLLLLLMEFPMNSLFLVSVVLLSFPVAQETSPVRTIKSGAWSDPATWESKKIPKAGDKVIIRTGHKVLYDVASKEIIRGMQIGGELAFDTTKDTLLEIGLIRVQPGDEYSEEGFECDGHFVAPDKVSNMPVFEIGNVSNPVHADKKAIIRLHYQEGMKKDSCPAIVCCGGRWETHGAVLDRSWVKLAKNADAGGKTLNVAEGIKGWKVGDKIVVTGSRTHGTKKDKSDSEERIISAIKGLEITIDTPLAMNHSGDGNYRAEVANLSRNIVIESANPDGERGHTMYHRDSAGSLAYTEFRHLGKKNTLGRYSLHFHLAGETMRGGFVKGNSIWDSHNRWVTIHGTNYLYVHDNVGYQSIGHGFFLEDGTEVNNILDRNLAIMAKVGKKLPKQVLGFDQNEGAGFWWANSLNTFTNNIAAECGLYGFRFEATPTSAQKLEFKILQPDGSYKLKDIRTLPFVKFDDNEVHSSHGLYGVNLGEGVNRVGPDMAHPFVVRNLKIWDIHYAFRPQVPSLMVENLDIYQASYGVYHPNFDNHYYKNVSISKTNTEPFNRGHDDLSVQYGLLAVDGLTFDDCRSGGMPLIQISDQNPTGKAESHFKNLKVVNWNDKSNSRAVVNLGGGPRLKPEFPHGVDVYVHDWFGAGKTALVSSTRAQDYKSNEKDFKKVNFFTGDESQAKEVTGVPFPRFPTPIDDLPPFSVITQIQKEGGKVLVEGVASDNGTVVKVLVNGKETTMTTSNFATWKILLDELPSGAMIEAKATDAAGNEERFSQKRKVR
ncbi:MAG: hypothetical protein EBQ87_08720 [Planctomycetes bacterium]|nr:hypothetical protein [Planctomycetota bacterium]